MERISFEHNIPDGFKLDKHINALDKKFGIIFNIIALAVIAVVMAIAFIPLIAGGGFSIPKSSPIEFFITWIVFMATMVAYIILHELAHGAAYKLLTREKLTFGISWSCAFCGVPHIYTYKKTALIAVATPLVLFTLVFLPLTVILYSVNPIYYLLSAFLLGMHLGGCSGDGYVIILLLFKYRKKRVLMKDTGPAQSFYVATDKEEN